jgi:hypothetical protein
LLIWRITGVELRAYPLRAENFRFIPVSSGAAKIYGSNIAGASALSVGGRT